TVSSHHLRFHCVVFEDGDESAQIVAPLIYVRVLSRNTVVLARLDSNNPGSESTISEASGDVLLTNGDVLRITRQVSIILQTQGPPAATPSAFDLVKQAEVRSFEDQYQVSGRMLGSGGNGTVFVAVKQPTKKQYACKIVSFAPRRQAGLAREYDLLSNLNHPNIISLEKVFCAAHNNYIVEELITGGDLLSYLDQRGSLSEPEAAIIVRQVLEAVEYLHSNQIVHRDIKPENVLVTSWRPGARVVLTDFGQARRLQSAKRAVLRMHTVIGTYGYTAPEVYAPTTRDLGHEKGYSKAIDIWSTGCVAATLLSGCPVFSDDRGDPLEDSQYWNTGFMDTLPQWRNVGRKAKSFIRGCLTTDETLRPTAKQASLHEWFSNRHYAAELEAAYQRAISDWKPRTIDGALVETVQTANAVLDAVMKAQQEENVRNGTESYHFRHAGTEGPLLSQFGCFQSSLSAIKPRHTPLPPITDDLNPDHAVNGRHEHLNAKPPYTGDGHPEPHDSTFNDRRFSACSESESFLTLSASIPRPPPRSQWDASITETQLMLD
ncbi:hypothetical protein BAUCODRAFT_67753, partial [Baudoinia panamericana UAMH 10762]